MGYWQGASRVFRPILSRNRDPRLGTQGEEELGEAQTHRFLSDPCRGLLQRPAIAKVLAHEQH